MNRCKIAGRNTDTRSETLVAIGLGEPSQAIAEGDVFTEPMFSVNVFVDFVHFSPPQIYL